VAKEKRKRSCVESVLEEKGRGRQRALSHLKARFLLLWKVCPTSHVNAMKYCFYLVKKDFDG